MQNEMIKFNMKMNPTLNTTIDISLNLKQYSDCLQVIVLK